MQDSTPLDSNTVLRIDQTMATGTNLHEVEKGLGSKGKLKILRVLMERPDHAFTRYEVGKKVATDPVSIRNDLETLVQIGWVTKLKIQHLHKYSINLEHAVVQRLYTFLMEIKYLQ